MTELLVQERDRVGTGASRELRRKGLIPGNLYGKKEGNISLSLAENEVTRLYRKPGFSSTVITLTMGDKSFKVLPRSVDLHPLTDLVRHIDFLYVNEGMQKVMVPLLFVGKDKSVGLKRGGFLNIIKRKVELFCPSDNIPVNLTVDVEKMHVGSTLKMSHLVLPEGCSLVSKRDLVLASITGRGGKAAAGEEAPAAPAAKK